MSGGKWRITRADLNLEQNSKSRFTFFFNFGF